MSVTQCEIHDDWLPTPDNIRALPRPVAEYIHALHTRCDPSYDVQHITCLQDYVNQLESALLQARSFAALYFDDFKERRLLAISHAE